MNEQAKCDFLRKRMIELREKNGKSQAEMAELIGCNKSTLSRAEKIGGDTGYKTVRGFAEDYCDKLGLTPEQKALFLRGEKIVVIDTSALLKNPQLIDELSKEYSRVIIPKIVVDELDNIKDHNTNGLASKAWQLLKSIGGNENVITMDYTGEETDDNNDCKIIGVAEQAAEEFSCEADLITYDAGFAARLSGHETVRALFLEEYMITKQNLMDINSLKKLNDYYADSYDDVERILKIKIPNADDINAYLPDGNTLIISVVRNKRMPMNQRQEKIKWLIAHGADVNRRDCGKYYFPPLSHSIQNIARINHALESMPKQLSEAQMKLETVERQLETAKAEVTKPFAQEAELVEKLERLSALNALLNMDEKGDDAIGMDDVPEEENGGQETSGHDVQKPGQTENVSEQPETVEKAANAPIPYPVENTRRDYTMGNGGLRVAAAMADKPVQRASLKEKLAAYKAQASGADRADTEKAKRKEETL